jgi:hypothetical protein
MWPFFFASLFGPPYKMYNGGGCLWDLLDLTKISNLTTIKISN